METDTLFQEFEIEANNVIDGMPLNFAIKKDMLRQELQHVKRAYSGEFKAMSFQVMLSSFVNRLEMAKAMADVKWKDIRAKYSDDAITNAVLFIICAKAA